MRAPCPRGESGFTLIELSIAMFIMSIGILGITGMFEHAYGSLKFAKELNAANRVTQTTMEKLSSLGYESVLNGMPPGNYSVSGPTKANWENQSLDGIDYTVTVEIVEDYVITGSVEVVKALVMVTWVHKGITRKVRYETYL